MKYSKVIVVFVALLFAGWLNAQDFLTPSLYFSHQKTAYVTLANGTEIKGDITKIKRKKYLIKQVNIKDGAGTKHKLKPTEIKFMYLPPSGYDKLAKAVGFLNNAQKWNNEKLNQDFLNQGYVYFETANVKIKKKTRPFLMQLLNPTFSKKVKVYHDPLAKKTASVGVGGVTLAGGLSKSYFIMFDTYSVAYLIKKGSYKKEFPLLWKQCKALSSMNVDEIKWKDLPKHVIQYTECESVKD